jgi:hypothetical protein
LPCSSRRIAAYADAKFDERLDARVEMSAVTSLSKIGQRYVSSVSSKDVGKPSHIG